MLFVGFQAIGTRGRALQEGKQVVRIYGREIPVRARIETLDGLSAHADRGEICSLGCRRDPATRTRAPRARRARRAGRVSRVDPRERMRLDVHCPDYLDTVEV